MMVSDSTSWRILSNSICSFEIHIWSRLNCYVCVLQPYEEMLNCIYQLVTIKTKWKYVLSPDICALDAGILEAEAIKV